MKSVCVFCGSNPGNDPVYAEGARAMGREIARRGLILVYGGGAVGLMGIVADAALEAGGEVHGVIPRALREKEVGHHHLTRLEIVDTMHIRKARMAELQQKIHEERKERMRLETLLATPVPKRKSTVAFMHVVVAMMMAME